MAEVKDVKRKAEEDVSLGDHECDECTEGTCSIEASSEDKESSSEEMDAISHMYELFTNTQGVNVSEAILHLNETLGKTNKILYKLVGLFESKSKSGGSSSA